MKKSILLLSMILAGFGSPSVCADEFDELDFGSFDDSSDGSSEESSDDFSSDFDSDFNSDFSSDFDSGFDSDYSDDSGSGDLAAAINYQTSVLYQKDAEDEFQLAQHALSLDLNYETSLSDSLYFVFDGVTAINLLDDQVFDESLVVNELYLQTSVSDHSLSVGKQKVGWGEVEGSSTLDVITPTSLSAGSSAQAATQWLANWQWYVSDKVQVQGVFVPKDEIISNQLIDKDLLPEYGLKLSYQINQGDVAFYSGSFLNELAVLDAENQPIEDRFYMAGLSLNHAFGSALVKFDSAFKHGIAMPSPSSSDGFDEMDRLDASIGLEYGFSAGALAGFNITALAQVQYFTEPPKLEALAELAGTTSPVKQTQALGALLLSDAFMNDDLSLNAAFAADAYLDFATAMLNGEYKYSDSWTFNAHGSYIRAAQDSVMVTLDGQISAGAGVSYQF